VLIKFGHLDIHETFWEKDAHQANQQEYNDEEAPVQEFEEPEVDAMGNIS